MTSSFGKIVCLCGLLAATSSCNLALDTDHHPFQDLIVIDFDGGSDPDAPSVDAPPVVDGEPVLMVTEIMIATDADSVGLGESGEYIEVKNVGDAPADPRNISIVVSRIDGEGSKQTGVILVSPPTSEEQVQVVSRLRPIEPGGYFVFVRYENAGVPLSELMDPGAYYDFGSYGTAASISNEMERLLELQYTDGQSLTKFDEVRWKDGALVGSQGDATLAVEDNVALSVAPSMEHPDANDSADAWCAEPERMGDAPETYYGSPGQSAGCARQNR